jgi:CheY-like chemotaxis protein
LGGFLTFRDLSHPSWGSGEVVHTLTDSAHLFIFVLAPQQNSLVGWSNNSEAVLGLKDYEVAQDGNLFLRHAHQDDRYRLLNHLDDLFARRAPIRIVYRWIRPDTGDLRWVLCRADPAQRDEGAVYEGILADITAEVQQTGGEIQNGSSLFQALGMWAAILDSDGRITCLHVPNGLCGFHLGDDNFNPENLCVGKVLVDGFSSTAESNEIQDLLNEILAGRKIHASKRIEWNGRCLIMDLRTISADSRPGNVLITVRDHTEVERLEAAAALANRSENFLQLSGGALHNINNSLQVVLGYTATIARNPHNLELIRDTCVAITKAIEEAAEVTHQAIAYKDTITQSLGPTDLNIAVMTALNRVQDILSHGTKIAVSLGNIPPITAHAPSLVHALESLLRLAHLHFGSTMALTLHTTAGEHRFPSDSGSTLQTGCIITISTGLPSSHPRCSDSPRECTPSAEAPPHVLEKMPSVWAELGAHFQHKTGPSGTGSLSVCFPCHTAAQLPEHTTPVVMPELLIIDDDLGILQGLSRVLNEAGYKTASSTNRRSAIQTFKRHAQSIRLVILDALLPSTHGKTILRQLKKINPSVLVLGFSGASTPDLESLREAGAAEVLRKPLHPEKLLKTVRSLLGVQDAA